MECTAVLGKKHKFSLGMKRTNVFINTTVTYFFRKKCFCMVLKKHWQLKGHERDAPVNTFSLLLFILRDKL